jgi:threonylcarbamoyladenosine tRNA methylthiotransferase MtaB
MKEVVPVKVRGQRTTMLRGLSEKKKRAFYESQMGKTRPVLFEHDVKNGKMEGYTDNYIRVVTDYDPLLIDAIVPFHMQHIDADFLMQGTFESAHITL